MLYLALKTLVSYRISQCTDCLPWKKLMQKFAIFTRVYSPLGRHWEGYLPVLRLYKKHAHNLEYKRLICYSCEL